MGGQGLTPFCVTPCGSCPSPRSRQLGAHAPLDAILVCAQTVHPVSWLHPDLLQSQDPCVPGAAHPPQRDSGLAACTRFKGHGGCLGQLLHLHMHPIQPGSWAGLPLGHCNPLLQDWVPTEPGVPAWSPLSAEGRLLRRGRLGSTLAAHVTSFVPASFSGGSLLLPLCRARWDPRPWPPFLVWDWLLPACWPGFSGSERSPATLLRS